MPRKAHFEACLRITPPMTGPARVFLERISVLRSSPPGADWDGIWHYQKKVGQTKPPQPVCTKDESAIISGVPAPRMTRLAS